MGCCSCTVKTKKILVFGIGGGLLVVGLFIGGFMNMIVDSVLSSAMVLREGSLTYDKWIKLPVDLYMEFYMFNVTNSEEYAKNQSIKPILKEIGPYVFREYHGRNILGWNDNNGTITFQNIRTWQFAPELSDGLENDLIMTINAVPATLNYLARLMGPVERVLLSSLLTVSGEGMFINKTVRELLFDGYQDRILDVVNKLNTSISIPFKQFGYFVDRNGSETYDGVFNMYTGKDNIELLGTVAEWNYNSSTPYYERPCSDVTGTTGELWGPIRNKNDVGIFAPDICMTLKLKYSGAAELNGLEGYSYLLRDNAFNNSDPEASCTCLQDTDCVPAGLLNVSACRYNAPVFVSRPHFLLSNSSLLDAVEGLKPDPEKHKLRLGLEPTTGAPMFVDARLMLNLLLEPVKHIKMFENLPRRIYFPVFWFNQKAVLSDELSTLAKLVQIAPDVGMGVFFGLAGIGALMLFIGIMLTVRHGWKGSDTQGLIYEN
ncbi:protein croquemort-like [Schistocerca piceifrons]|uniref:protein croquemort-like n=1 Tax=Schistocerca piceifrons TaxID=274613 RepID=UPI001F5ECEF2|nr:protein croquemort-like [Schistocerca piceifrons]XP_047119616.1 protein croquemort-like [Schistocerca piceifrons]XP_047119617.1 protein croquemort-like [Schistocerca piceifrons]XP_047119618.1 protein croquemort-like [Schistocerca piceifrons]